MTETTARKVVRFADAELDLRAREIRRLGVRVDITQRAFDLLAYLSSRPGELVTKDDVLGRVWAGRVVSDAALTKRVQELRHALGDDPRAPKLIETVHRKGFRFIGAIEGSPTAVHGSEQPPSGREAERATLRSALARATAGPAELVLVVGEAGIGKTRLAEDLIAEVGGGGHHCIARGHCHNRFGAGEPYAPWLEVMAALCRQSEAMRARLAGIAPSWLSQLPGMASPVELRGLQQRAAGATPQLVLRELAESLEAAASEQPMLIVLEDLQWADPPTLGALLYLTRRHEATRRLIVATLRTEMTDANGSDGVRAELASLDHCTTLAVGPLARDGIATWLAARFPPPGAVPIDLLADAIHAHCGGNPLFVRQLIDDLIAGGTLTRDGDTWRLLGEPGEVFATVPDSIGRLVAHQLQRLTDVERNVLDAAAVLGTAFSAEGVAAVLKSALAPVEHVLDALVARNHFVGADADPAAFLPYRFRHQLLQDALYSKLAPANRARLHARAGAWLGANGQTEPAVLATHYERGRAFEPAAREYLRAGERALERSAHAEALSAFDHGHALLDRLPERDAPVRLRAALHADRGSALVALRGYTLPEVIAAFERSKALSQPDNEWRYRFMPLHGLRASSLLRAELERTHALDGEIADLAAETGDPALKVWSLILEGETHYHRGDLPAASRCLDDALVRFDPSHPDPHASLAWARPFAGLHGYRAAVLVEQGYVESALAALAAGFEIADMMPHPYSRAFLHYMAAQVRFQRGEWMRAAEESELLVALATEHGFPQLRGIGLLLGASAQALTLSNVDVARRVEEGLHVLDQTGVRLGRGSALGASATVRANSGDFDGAMRLIAEGIEVSRANGERLREAALEGAGAGMMVRFRRGGIENIDAAMQRAIACARACGARLLEVRALAGRVLVARFMQYGARDRLEELTSAMSGMAELAALDDPILRLVLGPGGR